MAVSVEVRSLASMYLGQYLNELCNEAYERFKQEEGIPTGSQYDERNLAGVVAMELRDLELDEMLDDFNDDESAELTNERVRDYAFENNDPDFLQNKFEYRYDYDSANATAAENILDALRGNPETSGVNDSYWMSKIRLIFTLKERIEMAENIDVFLEQYAPDLDEIKKQN